MLHSNKIRAHVCLEAIILVFSLSLAPSYGSPKKEPPLPLKNTLPVPKEQHTLMTLWPYIADFSVTADRIYALPKSLAFYTHGPYGSQGKTHTETFGAVTDSHRVHIKETNPGGWHGIIAHPQGALLMDGRRHFMWEVDLKGNLVAKHSIVIDRIRPAAESRGEPTEAATRALRKRFMKVFSESSQFTGINPYTSAHSDPNAVDYLVTTQIKGFPLLSMRCDKNTPSRCRIARHCNATTSEITGEWVGATVSTSTNHLLVGNSKNNRIEVHRWDSCFTSVHIGSIALPKRFKKIGSLHIDAAENLWVSTVDKDDYTNASIFKWPKATWQAQLPLKP